MEILVLLAGLLDGPRPASGTWSHTFDTWGRTCPLCRTQHLSETCPTCGMPSTLDPSDILTSE